MNKTGYVFISYARKDGSNYAVQLDDTRVNVVSEHGGINVASIRHRILLPNLKEL